MVTLGKLCVVGGLRCVVGFAVVTVVVVDASVVEVVVGVSIVVTSLSWTDWYVCNFMFSVVVATVTVVGDLVM